jgi:hypothetical protein
MTNKVLVEKHSGEKEPFSSEKLYQSLQRAGAAPHLIARVEKELQPMIFEGITTKEIYRKAFGLLRKLKRSTAARYSLKNAIMELGPSGYPFEHFIGALLANLGYQVKVGQIVQGHCIQHEVDVVARNDHQQCMIECKFYNSQGKYCNVRVPLYIDSRFRDIQEMWRKEPDNKDFSFKGWVVTNTRFTTDAMDYGRCAGLTMVSWDYPRRGSLKDMVERTGLFPITALTLLNKKQKEHLLNQGIVLCRHLLKKPGLLDQLDLTKAKREKILAEAEELVGDIEILT